MKMVPALVRHATLLCLVAGSAVALTACDRESEAQRKVSESSRTLVALTGGGSAPAHPADQQKAFSAVSAAATVDGATEGEEGAAALLASVSHDRGKVESMREFVHAFEGPKGVLRSSMARRSFRRRKLR